MTCTIIGKLASDQLKKNDLAFSETENRIYGELPLLDLSNLAYKASIKNVTYSLETPSGRLFLSRPDSFNEFETPINIVRVYKYIEPKQTLFSLQKSLELAKKMGFGQEYKKSGTLVTLQSGTRTLELDIVQGSVIIKNDNVKDLSFDKLKDFSGNPNNYSSEFLPNLISESFLNANYENAWVNSEYISFDKEKNVFYKESSPLRAEFLRMSFQKKFLLNTIEAKSTDSEAKKNLASTKQYLSKVYNESPRFPNSMLISGTSIRLSDIYSFTSPNWYASTLVPSNIGKYKIFSIQEAWQKIQNNEGILVDLKRASRTDDYDLKNANEKITKMYIKKIELGYYESEKFQEYLQPIYVFVGAAVLENEDGNSEQAEFTIYLPAIKR
ncbi:hypothetical protein IPJ91_02290 [bacterium]|nr:MAG: hypothetical protein IPJ91_02290 [bacterium]